MFKLSWNNATSPDRVELVFENRNKSYGAFVIRKAYDRSVLTSFLIAVSVVIFAFYLPAIIRLISGAIEETTKAKPKTVITELAPPPDMDDTKPPPPPPEIKLPDLKEVKFTPPEIVPDEEVVEEIVDLKEMDKAIIGNENNLDGDTVSYDAPPVENTVIEEDETPLLYVSDMPAFPGGEDAMYAYIYKNISYPPLAREAGVQGTVLVKFVVEKDGSVSGVEAVKGPEYGLKEEAIKAIKKLPAFKPGMQNAKAVRVQFTIPIRFQLNQ